MGLLQIYRAHNISNKLHILLFINHIKDVCWHCRLPVDFNFLKFMALRPIVIHPIL
jgi:hypothetical protein